MTTNIFLHSEEILIHIMLLCFVYIAYLTAKWHSLRSLHLRNTLFNIYRAAWLIDFILFHVLFKGNVNNANGTLHKAYDILNSKDLYRAITYWDSRPRILMSVYMYLLWFSRLIWRLLIDNLNYRLLLQGSRLEVKRIWTNC